MQNFSSVLCACGKEANDGTSQINASGKPFFGVSNGLLGLDADFVSSLVPAALDVARIVGKSGVINNYPDQEDYNQVVRLFFCGHYDSFDWCSLSGLLG